MRRESIRNHPSTIEFRKKVESFLVETEATEEIAYSIRSDLKKKTEMPFYGVQFPRVRMVNSDKDRFRAYVHLLLKYDDFDFSKQLLRSLNRQQNQTFRRIALRRGEKSYRWEHVMPAGWVVDRILELMLEKDLRGIDKLLNMFEEAGQVGVTKDQDARLNLLGLRSGMPADWDWRADSADLFVRYRMAKIEKHLSSASEKQD